MSTLSTAFHVKEELRAEIQEPKFWPAAHKSQALYAISVPKSVSICKATCAQPRIQAIDTNMGSTVWKITT